MGVVFATLAFTIFLFVSEIIRIDLAAILVLVVLGMLSYLPGLSNIADVNHLFDGFASNAVISIIAVMIVGAGLDKTGIMNKVAAAILRHGGSTEFRILPIVSATVGTISSFLQNVGAAALFLPVRNLIYTLYMRRAHREGDVEPETAARLKRRSDITAGLLCFVFSFLYTPTLFQN